MHYSKDHQRTKINSENEYEDEVESDVSYNSEEEQYIDQDDYKEGYLIMEVSNEESDRDFTIPRSKEERLGHLLEDIQNQDNLSLEEMVNKGILVPNTYVPGNSKSSGWSFPVRYVPKKTGDKRSVTNFRLLNEVTIRDPWPMPNMVNVLESLAVSNYYVNADLLKAFQQIAVDSDSIDKLTIINTPYGAYSYKCMPFGDLNGPACFSRCVYLALKPFLGEFAVNFYDDDCVLYAKGKPELMSKIEKFLKRMREVNLKLNANKCKFFKEEIVVLCFVVNGNGISPVPSKVEKIVNFPRPVNTTGIRAFVNLCGFYRRHIPAFSDLSAPMNELLKKRVQFVWSPECEKSFNDLKEAMINAVTLVIQDPDTKYNLYTDASDIGIGACLPTITADGIEKPVLFLSRKLQSAEIKYPTVEKELLAVIYAMRKLRKYLLDNEFTLYCDTVTQPYAIYSMRMSHRNVYKDGLYVLKSIGLKLSTCLPGVMQ